MIKKTGPAVSPFRFYHCLKTQPMQPFCFIFSSDVLSLLIFIVPICIFLALDLGIFSKHSHFPSFKESLIWTTCWIALALGFFLYIKFEGNMIHGIVPDDPNAMRKLQEIVTRYGHAIRINGLSIDDAIKVYNNNLSIEYITGYIVEYALSVDNIFVMLLLFMAFNVQKKYYKRVLVWGILGAVVMRMLFILLSATLIQRFAWILYVFGAFLVFTGIRMLIEIMKHKEEHVDTAKYPVVKFASKYFNVYPKYVGGRFWIRKNAKFYFTPLFLVLLVIEFTDIIFAVDSVPAIFSITKDPYIVFFSNIFAILGLRSLFFVVYSMIRQIKYLKHGLSALLCFIGLKMLLHDFVHIDATESLLIIVGILFISFMASFVSNLRGKDKIAK